MSTAEKIYRKAQLLPDAAQTAVLHLVERLAEEHSGNGLATPSTLTQAEAAELRGKLEAWEEDWNAPGMEAYDRP